MSTENKFTTSEGYFVSPDRNITVCHIKVLYLCLCIYTDHSLKSSVTEQADVINVSCRLLQSVLSLSEMTEDDYNVFTTITPG